MGAFSPESFGAGFGALLADGDPAFQGAAFDGGAFHIMGEPEGDSGGRGGRAVLYRRPRPIPVPLLDEADEFFTVI